MVDVKEFLKTEYCPEPDVLTRSFKWVKDLDGQTGEFTGDETLRNTLKDDADTGYAAFAATMSTEAEGWWDNLRTSVFVGSTEYDEKDIVWKWCRDDLPHTP